MTSDERQGARPHPQRSRERAYTAHAPRPQREPAFVTEHEYYARLRELLRNESHHAALRFVQSARLSTVRLTPRALERVATSLRTHRSLLREILEVLLAQGHTPAADPAVLIRYILLAKSAKSTAALWMLWQSFDPPRRPLECSEHGVWQHFLEAASDCDVPALAIEVLATLGARYDAARHATFGTLDPALRHLSRSAPNSQTRDAAMTLLAGGYVEPARWFEALKACSQQGQVPSPYFDGVCRTLGRWIVHTWFAQPERFAERAAALFDAVASLESHGDDAWLGIVMRARDAYAVCINHRARNVFDAHIDPALSDDEFRERVTSGRIAEALMALLQRDNADLLFKSEYASSGPGKPFEAALDDFADLVAPLLHQTRVLTPEARDARQSELQSRFRCAWQPVLTERSRAVQALSYSIRALSRRLWSFSRRRDILHEARNKILRQTHEARGEPATLETLRTWLVNTRALFGSTLALGVFETHVQGEITRTFFHSKLLPPGTTLEQDRLSSEPPVCAGHRFAREEVVAPMFREALMNAVRALECLPERDRWMRVASELKDPDGPLQGPRLRVTISNNYGRESPNRAPSTGLGLMLISQQAASLRGANQTGRAFTQREEIEGRSDLFRFSLILELPVFVPKDTESARE